jgi:hypothetical protein
VFITRKIVAFFVCSLLAFSLGFSLLPNSFYVIVGWLGPVFGTSLHVFLSMVFILFENPFLFPAIQFLWITVGVVCGLIIRRRLGSLSFALLIQGVMFFIIIVSTLSLFEIASNLGVLQNPQEALNFLPPLPQGATLASVMSSPIVNDIYTSVQGISFTSPPQLTNIIFTVFGSIISNFVINLILLLVSSIVGCEVGKLIERKKISKKLSAKKLKIEVKNSITKRVAPLNFRKSITSFFSVFFVSLLVFSLLVTNPVAFENGSTASYYAEGIIGFATPDGTAYLGSAFADSEALFNGINFSSIEFSDAVVSVLISHDTSVTTLPPIIDSISGLGENISQIPAEILQNLTKFYELVPKTLFLTCYVDLDPVLARQRADFVASKFSTYGGQLTFLIDFTQQATLGNITRNFTFLIYQSTALLSDLEGDIMNTIPVHRGGLASVMSSVYKNGTLTPGATSKSANGTIMAVGLFSSSLISSLLGLEEQVPQETLKLIFPNTTKPTPMVGVFSYWLNKFHSSSFNQTFNLNDLLNYQGIIHFSPQAKLSLIATFVPTAIVENGQVIKQEPILSLLTSINLTSLEFESLREIIRIIDESAHIQTTQVNPGESLTAEKLSVIFTQVFPLNLRIQKSVSLNKVNIGNEVEVFIKIFNNDTDSAENVTLNDSLLSMYYNSWALQVEGNLTNTWRIIPGNSSVTHNYSILLKKEGTYLIPNTELTYFYMNQSYNAKSSGQYIQVKSPSLFNLFLDGIPAVWGILQRSIDRIPSLQGNGSLILTGITLSLITPIIFFEYLNIKKYLKTK